MPKTFIFQDWQCPLISTDERHTNSWSLSLSEASVSTSVKEDNNNQCKLWGYEYKALITIHTVDNQQIIIFISLLLAAASILSNHHLHFSTQ